MVVEFAVAVVKEILRFDFQFLEMDADIACLLREPVAVRTNGDAAQVNLARFEMDEEEDEAVCNAELGEDFARDEVAGPDSLRVTLEETGPVAAFSLRAGFDAVLVEYVLDGGASDFVALAEFDQLAVDAGVAPRGIFFSEADDSWRMSSGRGGRPGASLD